VIGQQAADAVTVLWQETNLLHFCLVQRAQIDQHIRTVGLPRCDLLLISHPIPMVAASNGLDIWPPSHKLGRLSSGPPTMSSGPLSRPTRLSPSLYGFNSSRDIFGEGRAPISASPTMADSTQMPSHPCPGLRIVAESSDLCIR
jgi:hypothetical protein